MNSKKYFKEFSKIILEEFTEILLKKCFKKEFKRVETGLCEHLFCNNKQYIKIIACHDFRDSIFYWNIKLGEGDWDNFVESDWNSVGIQQIVDEQGGTSVGKYLFRDFNFEIGGIVDIVKKGKVDLEKYANEFLNGNSKMFYKIRSVVNQHRVPYKIYSPDGNGKYIETIDEESARLKKKYS